MADDIECKPGERFSIDITLPVPWEESYWIEAEWLGPTNPRVGEPNDFPVYADRKPLGVSKTRCQVTGEVWPGTPSGQYWAKVARIAEPSGKAVCELHELYDLLLNVRDLSASDDDDEDNGE